MHCSVTTGKRIRLKPPNSTSSSSEPSAIFPLRHYLLMVIKKLKLMVKMLLSSKSWGGTKKYLLYIYLFIHLFIQQLWFYGTIVFSLQAFTLMSKGYYLKYKYNPSGKYGLKLLCWMCPLLKELMTEYSVKPLWPFINGSVKDVLILHYCWN